MSIQQRLYNALTNDIVGEQTPIPALGLFDTLEEVFRGDELNVKALLQRYKDYLNRLKDKGLNPWKEQPKRADLNYTEAVGHFHLYAWLLDAVGRRCIVSPEFPTGNGKVDLHLRCGQKEGIIEVKSFTNASDLKESKEQAARYAKGLNKDSVTLALFIPSIDEKILNHFTGEEFIDSVRVTLVSIGWAVS